MSVITKMQAGVWPSQADQGAIDVAMASIAPDQGSVIIPGIPPILIEITDAIKAVMDLIDIILALNAAESYTPWGAIIELILILIEELFPLFIGRPRQEATLNCVQNLMKAKNSAATIAGNNLLRLFNDFDIVISESGPGEALVALVVGQFVTNLMGQGIEEKIARNIVLLQFTKGADKLGFINPRLMQYTPSNVLINGPQGFQRVFQIVEDHYLKLGQKLIKAQEHAWEDMLKYAPLKWLTHITFQYTNPLPPVQCQTGYHWDFQLEKCVPDDNSQNCPDGTVWDPISQTCVPIPPIWPITDPDPDGDEITDDLCAQLGGYTGQIIKALQALEVAGGNDPACCAAVVAALADISGALADIVNQLPPNTALGDIANGLKAIAAALSGIGGTGTPVDLTPVTEALDKIASAIASSPGTDVSGIVDQLKQMVSEMDIPEATFDLLVQRGYMQPEERSLYQGDPVGDAIFKFLGTHGYWAYVGVMRLFGWDPTTAAPYTRSIGSDTEKLFADGFMAFVSGSDTEILPAVEKLVDGVKSLLAPASTPAVGDAGVPLDKPIAFATSVGLTSAIAAKFMAYWGWDIGEPLTKLSELISTAIGYEELRDVQIGPYIRNGIAKVADMQAKALFQQELPGAGAVFSWVARGLLDSARADQLAALDGLHFSLRGPALQSAYHGMQARQLIRLSGTGLFTEGDLVDELTFSGMRPASQKRLLTAAPWLATNSQRGKLKATLEKFYVEGFLSDADLDQELAQLNHDVDGDGMSLRASQIEKQIVFAKRLEVAYSKQFISGLIIESQYRGLLEGIGLQPDWINNKVAVDQASDQAIEYRKELAAELAAERATVAEERRAATKNYLAGNTNTAGLAGSLLLTGLNANQAAAWVDLATATRAGNLRWVYGLQLAPGDATLLRARVAALTDQRKRQLIADVAYEGALKALGIPAHWVNSLRATADAMLTPAKDAIHLPVTLPLP